MSKYKDNFDKLANSIYNKLTEAAQQDPTMQAQQPVDPNAGAVADPTAGAAMQPDASAAGVAAADPSVMAAGAEDPSLQTGDEGQDAGAADEVGMSEIQEMAGQLAQMLRDFKETNPDEFIEAAKFAAGMVVSAAISGLKYKDRKDILKKVKAGEFNQDSSDESSTEEQQVEQQPEGQEEMVAERLRKDDSRETDDDRKGLNPKEKKNIRSKKSPFSGVNENGVGTYMGGDNTTVSDIEKFSQDAAANDNQGVNIVNPNGNGKTATVSDPISAQQQLTLGNNVYMGSQANESIKLTKRQLDMIRLSETKTKFVKFSKKQLDEIMKK
jgi:hypothetical protein